MSLDCSLNLHLGVPHYLHSDDGTSEIFGYFCYVCDVETEPPVERGRDGLGRPIGYAKAKKG